MKRDAETKESAAQLLQNTLRLLESTRVVYDRQQDRENTTWGEIEVMIKWTHYLGQPLKSVLTECERL